MKQSRQKLHLSNSLICKALLSLLAVTAIVQSAVEITASSVNIRDLQTAEGYRNPGIIVPRKIRITNEITPVSGTIKIIHSSEQDTQSEPVVKNLSIKAAKEDGFSYLLWEDVELKVIATYSDGGTSAVPANWVITSGEGYLNNCTVSSTCRVSFKKHTPINIKATFNSVSTTYTIALPRYWLKTPLLQTPVYFDEIPDWAKPTAEMLGRLGIMKGYEDGTFKPEEPVTNAQVATMLYRAIKTARPNIEGVCDNSYKATIAKDHFAYEAFCYFGDNAYDISWALKADEPITRLQVATLITDVLEAEFIEHSFGKEVLEVINRSDFRLYNVEGLEKYATDIPDTTTAHYAIYFMTLSNIMTPQEGKFRPNDQLNRAEAAAVILRSFSHLMKFEQENGRQ